MCLWFERVDVKPRYISWLPDCQTESVGGDIHRGAFSGTFMRDFFPRLKKRLTTHSKVASARHEPRVYACMYGALPLSTPTWAARGAIRFMFCFREPSPVLRKCCRKQWELTPSSASVALKKGLGLSGRREGREEGMGAVRLGMSRPCGWLSARAHTGAVTSALRRAIPVHTTLLAWSKYNPHLWRGILRNLNRCVSLCKCVSKGRLVHVCTEVFLETVVAAPSSRTSFG